jgi:VWFA-related protein
VRRASLRPVVVAAALAVGSFHAAAQPPAGGNRTGFDLLVTDAAGRPLTGLRAGDVTLSEDGVDRRIDELRPPAPDEPRLFAIFLDEYHVQDADTAGVREAIGAFLQHDLAPGDRAVVLKPLDSLVGIRLSDDHAALAAAAAAFEGRRGDFTARNAFERNFLARSPSVVEQTRLQVSWAAVAALADALGRAGDGRKTLIVVSEDLGTVRRLRGIRTAGPDGVSRLANRGRVAVYALDPSTDTPAASGTEAGPGSGGAAAESPLAALARGTAGRTARGALGATLGAAAADARNYYWVTFDSGAGHDGRFHRIAITVKRPHAIVRAREGFWAPSAIAERLAAEAAAPLAPLPVPEPYHASPLINPWFGFSRGPNGSTRVTFVWEPAAQMPRIAQAPRGRTAAVPTRIVLEALGPDGSPIFHGDVLPAAPDNEAAGTAAARAVFDAPPGRLRLQMSVQGLPGRPGGDTELDHDVRSISVRALDGAVTMGSTEVVRTFNAIDWRRAVVDPDAIPSASREFSRTERLLIRFPVYAEGRIDARAQLLGPDERPLRDLEVQPGPGGPGMFQIDLPLANFAQGPYTIAITARAPAGEARDSVPFRVTY